MAKRSTQKAPIKDRNVYVIELDKEVLRDRKFLLANPGHDPEKDCFYVGMTARTPEERFEQHKRGIKSCRLVRKYGKWLRPRQFRKYNPMTYADAEKKEVELANELRAKGHAVWQH